MNDIVQDPFESLMQHLNTLQTDLNNMNSSINQINIQHESLKQEVVVNIETELHDDLNNQIISMTQSVTEHVQHAEQMMQGLIDPQRMQHMSNLVILQGKIMDASQSLKTKEVP